MSPTRDSDQPPHDVEPVTKSDDRPPLDLDGLYPDLLENEGVPNYRLGRKYARTVAAAHRAVNAGDLDLCAHLMEAADRLIWPLDEADAGDLRDFIAGVAREDEVRIINGRDASNCPTTS